MMRFVDIKNDVAFRKIFGNEKKKEIIISFLNAILNLKKGKRIISAKIENPFKLPEIKGLKSTLLDVRVTDERDVSYIVEMQVEEPDGFDKRVQYYTAKQYSSQIEIGDDYPKLNQVIFIGILDFDFFEGDKYVSRHLIINTNTGKQDLKDLEFNFIELKKFNKTIEELVTSEDKWIFFLKNVKNLDVIPENIDDEGLKHAYEDAEKHSWTKDELMAYDYAAMRKQDEKGKVELAIRRATIEAEKRGEKRGEKNEKIIAAKKGISAGLSNDIITTMTGLTEKEVEQIRKNEQK